MTDENYYSNNANWAYQSATWFKKFQVCEAEALAELEGEWQPERDPTALLAGNYLHSYFESPTAHQHFIEAHPEMLSSRGKTKGQLKAPYQQAKKMITALVDDKQFKRLYQGEKEKKLTGKINGIPWMGKLDCLGVGYGYFVDLKTTQDIHKRYWLTDENRWGSFIEAYNYPLQMAVYQELVKQKYQIRPQVIIVAVTKQDPPDKAVIAVPQDTLDEAMGKLLATQERIEAVKNGQVPPCRCEHCDYCRATKRLGQIISMYDLID